MNRLTAPRLSDTVATQLEQRILEGTWKPGDRLPSERDLATELGVSRPSLREALQKLAVKGLISVRHGGGNFVTDRMESSLVDPWQDMMTKHPGLRADLLEFRHMLEGQAAALAAARATSADISRLDSAFDEMEKAYDAGEMDRVTKSDVAFHQVVAESAHNVLIGQMNASLLRLIHEDMAVNLAHLRMEPEYWGQLRGQHRRIWQAVREGRADDARDAARAHLEFVQASMAETDLREERLQTAQRRLAG